MFYCEVCDFTTDNRNNIEYHHIVPKELRGNDLPYNRVYLCPNHHKMVYVDGSMSGIHSIRNDNSIVIKGWFNSTEGRVLLIESEGTEKYLNAKNL